MTPHVLVLTRPASQVLEEAGAAGGRLTDVERQRMSRLRRPQDRDDFLAAHLLVRSCVARILGLDPGDVSIVQRCGTCGGPHGRPEVVGHPEVIASLAHSRGVVAAAAGTVPVGVDVEAVPPAGEPTPSAPRAAELSVVLTGAEIAAIEAAGDPARALLLAWTRKEACLKAGLVDLDGLGSLDLSALPFDPGVDALVPRLTPLGQWAVHDWWDSRTGAVGAVAAPAGTELELRGA